MPNRNYIKGRGKEQRVKAKLKKDGWHVTRSAASKGLFDLIALIPPHTNGEMDVELIGDMRLIQCKTGKSSKRAIKKVEKTDIKRFEGVYHATVEIV